MRKQGLQMMLSALAIAFCFIGIYAYADALRVHAEGMLTAIEDDGTVIIDEQGYLMDPAARVLDSEKKSVSPRSLSLPAKVYFEYEYSSRGTVIKLLEEIPKVTPK